MTTLKKKTIVFVSEMGEGLGHVLRLLTLAENLQKQDFNCIFLVSDLLRAGAKVQQSGFDVIAAPNMGLSTLKPGQQTTSMADILMRKGYSDFNRLAMILPILPFPITATLFFISLFFLGISIYL